MWESWIFTLAASPAYSAWVWLISMYKDGVLRITSTWTIYVHQLATPATHVSLVKLLNLGYYYVWCLLEGLLGGRWNVCRCKNFPNPIVTQICLTDAHLYPIINSGCLSTWWLCACACADVPLRHTPTNLVPHCQSGSQAKPFSVVISHVNSPAKCGVFCLWSRRTSLNTSALLSMLMSLLETSSMPWHWK